MFWIAKSILWVMGLLPLTLIHALGALLGRIVYLCNNTVVRRARENLKISGLSQNLEQDVCLTLQETSKNVLETLALWSKPVEQVAKLVRTVHNLETGLNALQAKKGIIFLTPHLGSFEVTSLFYGVYYGTKQPITVLYRPPRLSWLHPLIIAGRQRKGVHLAMANKAGVRQLLDALKRGEAVGILPDQVPRKGEGEWAMFFNRPAYTMTLASKLAQKTGAQVLMAFGERLPHGQGYSIHIHAVPNGGVATPDLLNREIEKLIAQCHTQYLWTYNRYKVLADTRAKLDEWQAKHQP